MHLKLTFHFHGDLFHGSGRGIAGVVDRAFQRDRSGIPYLAASAIKGKLRHAASQALRSLAESTCTPETLSYCRNTPCLVCQVFGSPRRQGIARFQDAYPYEPGDSNALFYRKWLESSASIVLSGPTSIRANAAINRRTRSIEQKRLWTTEVVNAGVTFHTTIEGITDEAHAGLLKQAARLIETFGAGSARGLGHCKLTIEQPSDDGRSA